MIYLSKDELKTILNLELKGDTLYLEPVRDMFMFCCFSSLRYSEASSLKWNDAKGDHIEVTTVKTADSLSIEINNLMGEESYLRKFINGAIRCTIISEDVKKGTRTYNLTNVCSIPFILRKGKSAQELEGFQSLRFTVGKNKETGSYFLPEFTVDNMWHIDEQHPVIEIEVD